MAADLWALFAAFFRVGLLGFGGGPAFMSLVEVEAVRNYGWMTPQEFTDALAAGNALPGPLATKMAGYIGYKVAGWPGAVAGVTALAAPTMVATIVLLGAMQRYRDVPAVKGALTALRPAIVALFAMLIADIFPQSIFSAVTAAIGVASLVALVYLRLHPLFVILGAIALGAAALR